MVEFAKFIGESENQLKVSLVLSLLQYMHNAVFVILHGMSESMFNFFLSSVRSNCPCACVDCENRRQQRSAADLIAGFGRPQASRPCGGRLEEGFHFDWSLPQFTKHLGIIRRVIQFWVVRVNSNEGTAAAGLEETRLFFGVRALKSDFRDFHKVRAAMIFSSIFIAFG